MQIARWIRVGSAILSLLATVPAYAQPAAGDQPERWDFPRGNFDLWCQEDMQLPAARCDKRLPDDENAYETYRDKIGDYEEALRLKWQKEDELDRSILNNDPVDNPQVP